MKTSHNQTQMQHLKQHGPGDYLGPTCGASNRAVGDVGAADVVHGSGVSPVGVNGRVGVVRALITESQT